MALPTDILLGLDAGPTQLVAVAFSADGRELARACLPHPVIHGDNGRAEQEQGESWQRVAALLRQLGQQLPGLARRTAALALTGPAGGCWLVDEDGDAVAPAILPLDRRAAPVVERWRASGVARAVALASGHDVTPGSQSAQLAWLGEHQPAALERAASVFCGKDWLHFCCTGERAGEATAALAAFGDLATGSYDERLLERLGLAEAARLLPAIIESSGDGDGHHGALAAAAAAASGLLAGTPVVLAPTDGIARSLAAGLGAGEDDLGSSDPVAGGLHVRACRSRPDAGWPERGIGITRFGGRWFGQAPQPATLEPELLVGLAEQLLADAGLIGVPRSEIAALLEAKAVAAAPGALRCWRDGAAAAGWNLSGLSAATTFYDLLRATYEALAAEAAACHGALGHRPREVRLLGARATAPLATATLAASLGTAVRPLGRAAPAAAGAALTAALSLGIYPDLAAVGGDWVEPFLGEPLAAAA